MLPDSAIKEFQMIFQKQFSIELSFEEARTRAENFIQLFDLTTSKPKEKEGHHEK